MSRSLNDIIGELTQLHVREDALLEELREFTAQETGNVNFTANFVSELPSVNEYPVHSYQMVFPAPDDEQDQSPEGDDPSV